MKRVMPVILVTVLALSLVPSPVNATSGMDKPLVPSNTYNFG
jgi:hypothetical protein